MSQGQNLPGDDDNNAKGQSSSGHGSGPNPGSNPGSNPGQSKGKGALFGGVGLVGIGLLKAKGMWLVALKLLGGLKFLVVFKSFIGMFVMIGVYTMMYGWFYALVVAGLILIHEMGHYIFMKAMGLEPKLPMFLPFIAYVQMTKLPKDQTTHAWVAIAGPLVGGVTSVAMFYLGHIYSIPALMAAGSTGIFLNVFQLIPAKPFDGGFIVNALSKWFLIPGTGLAFMLGAASSNPILLIIAVVSAFMTWRAFTRAPEPGGLINGETPSTPPEKFLIGTAYFGLMGGLGYIYWLSHNQLISLVKPHF